MCELRGISHIYILYSVSDYCHKKIVSNEGTLSSFSNSTHKSITHQRFYERSDLLSLRIMSHPYNKKRRQKIHLSMTEVLFHLSAHVDDLPRRCDHQEEASVANQLLLFDLEKSGRKRNEYKVSVDRHEIRIRYGCCVLTSTKYRSRSNSLNCRGRKFVEPRPSAVINNARGT